MTCRVKFVPLLTLLLVLGICRACPSACVCKWKNGKQTVECSNRGLLVIPEGMDSGTQVLEFSANNLRTLPTGKFYKLDLINLQRIYLARCQIVSVEAGTFRGLTNLVELDLAHNALETIPTAAFLDCPSLMRLVLSANPIRAVRQDAFGDLRFLHTLELSTCQLEDLEAGAFTSLQSLERLRLDGNQLTTLPGASTTMPHRLQEVDLQGNRWQCDCRMAEMREWLETYEPPTTVAPMCSGPARLHGRPVRSIPRLELACLPDVTPTTLYLEIAEGKNVSLQCQINAVPEARVSWWFQGQLLQNDTMLTSDTRLVYYVEDGGEDKRSELFIYNANSEDNGTFVCVASNPAGVVQSNFTIRIILRDEPGHEFAQLPFEFVAIIVAATGVSLLVICFALLLSVVKCQSERRRRRKAEARRNLVLSQSTKNSLLLESIEESSEFSKESSSEAALHADALVSSISPIVAGEQNPDLINDAESLSIGKRHDGDGEELYATIKYDEADVGVYRLSADVHLNPVGLLNATGAATIHFANGGCYRTLPYNRGVKRQASPRDAEFEHFHPTNVRYTADGYPARGCCDPDLDHDTESLRSCRSAPAVPWLPHAVPTPLVSILKHHSIDDRPTLQRKCVVGAQTQTDITALTPLTPPAKPANRAVAMKIVETLTESPDEGYEGDESQTKV